MSNEKPPISGSLAADEIGGKFSSIDERLDRYAEGKARALSMVNYIYTKGHDAKLSGVMRSCGSHLVFKKALDSGDNRLSSAITCKKHLLCPFCAMRRGAKAFQRYSQRLEQLVSENAISSDLKPYLVTLTIKDRGDLKNAYKAIKGAFSRLLECRRNSLKGLSSTEFSKIEGAVYSFEVKRGRNSGLWHPHVHMVAWCSSEINQTQLSREWLDLTGDSFIVDVRMLYSKEGRDSLTSGFLEVFKYAVKFSDMSLKDNWTAYETLKCKRLIGSFGFMYGVKIPDDLTDEDFEEGRPYILMFYKYSLAKKGYIPDGDIYSATGDLTPFRAMSEESEDEAT